MALNPNIDELGNPILEAPVPPQPQAPPFGIASTGDPTPPDPAAPAPTPAPAPSASEPQPTGPPLPEFGQGSSPSGDLTFPQVPAFEQPAPDALAQDQQTRDQASTIYGSDPGAPGNRYSGGADRRSNPLRETAVGQALARSGKRGTAYGNAGASDGLTGGGTGSRTIAGTSANEGAAPPSDLLLQLMQLLNSQQGQ